MTFGFSLISLAIKLATLTRSICKMRVNTKALPTFMLSFVLFTPGCYNNKKKVTEDVLAFLNAVDWWYSHSYENHPDSGIVNTDSMSKSKSKRFHYSDFVYDKTTETLTFKDSFKISDHFMYPKEQYVSMYHWYSFKRIHLKTAKPVIELVSTSEGYLDINDGELVGVEISGGMEIKSAKKEFAEYSKYDTLYFTAENSTNATDADWIALEENAFEKYKPESFTIFWVAKDHAPRLKAALSDLIEAHGVKVSKY